MDSYLIDTGQDYLCQYLEEPCFTLHETNEKDFQKWLIRESSFRQRDEHFQKRVQIRDLRKKHQSSLDQANELCRESKESYEKSPHKEKLEKLLLQIENREKALVGLEKAVQDRQGDKRKASEEKLAHFQKELEVWQQEKTQLLKLTPEKLKWEKALLKLANLKEKIGLTQAKADLEKLNKSLGRRMGSTGDAFEEQCRTFVRQIFFSVLAKRDPKFRRNYKKMHILRGVSLGCARAELDYVVVAKKREKEPVTVYAIVEAKRNINNMAESFSIRQENIAWFTKTEKDYPAELYRTKVFTKGHFDKEAIHKVQDEEFLFAPSSFDLFKKDPSTGHFMDRLFFICAKRYLMGMSPGDYSKIMYRISTDMEFDLEDEEYVRKLLGWSKENISPWVTYDLLKIYASKESWAQQIIVASRQKRKEKRKE